MEAKREDEEEEVAVGKKGERVGGDVIGDASGDANGDAVTPSSKPTKVAVTTNFNCFVIWRWQEVVDNGLRHVQLDLEQQGFSYTLLGRSAAWRKGDWCCDDIHRSWDLLNMASKSVCDEL